jgi:hypothetical protein
MKERYVDGKKRKSMARVRESLRGVGDRRKLMGEHFAQPHRITHVATCISDLLSRTTFPLQ